MILYVKLIPYYFLEGGRRKKGQQQKTSTAHILSFGHVRNLPIIIFP